MHTGTYTHTQSTHRHTHTHTSTHRHACTQARAHTHKHAHRHVHIHTSTHRHAHIHTRTHRCVHTRTQARTHTHKHACRHIHTHTQAHTGTHTRTGMYTYIQRHACRHVHIHTQACTRTQTHLLNVCPRAAGESISVAQGVACPAAATDMETEVTAGPMVPPWWAPVQLPQDSRTHSWSQPLVQGPFPLTLGVGVWEVASRVSRGPTRGTCVEDSGGFWLSGKGPSWGVTCASASRWAEQGQGRKQDPAFLPTRMAEATSSVFQISRSLELGSAAGRDRNPSTTAKASVIQLSLRTAGLSSASAAPSLEHQLFFDSQP